MALLRALAGDREPDRRSAPPIDLEQLGAAQREAIAGRLKELLSEMQGLDAKAARKAIDDLEGRLGAAVVCQRSPERASFWTGRRPQHVGGCMSEHRRQEPIWTSVRGAGVKAVSPAERGRSEATRLDVGEHTRTLLA